jgi:hypothetical protein
MHASRQDLHADAAGGARTNPGPATKHKCDNWACMVGGLWQAMATQDTAVLSSYRVYADRSTCMVTHVDRRYRQRNVLQRRLRSIGMLSGASTQHGESAVR